MKTSERGLAEIAAHEGIVTSRYKDSVGVWTIGVGHTKNAGAPDPMKIKGELSLDDIMEIFARDIKRFEKRVSSAFTRRLNQAQFDAAVSFDFNTGGIHRASWVKNFNAGDDQSAWHSFMKWRKPSEIIQRRNAERQLFFNGKYSGHGKVIVYTATTNGGVKWSSGKSVYLPKITADKTANLTQVETGNFSEPQFNKPKSKVGSLAVIVAAAGAVALMLRDKFVKYFQ